MRRRIEREKTTTTTTKKKNTFLTFQEKINYKKATKRKLRQNAIQTRQKMR